MSDVVERVTAPRSIGRVPGTLHAALVIVEGFWTWYRKGWRATAVSSVVQPLLFLVALGVGFGSQVQPGAATGGLRYLVYLAPALLVATSVQIAAFESTYPVLSGFKWQGQYIAVTSSPITPGQLVGGLFSWLGIRMASAGAVYLGIAALLGAVSGPAVLVTLPVALLTGLAVAACVTAYTATVEREESFPGLFRFIVLPMTLFAGTFFPVGSLPVWIRPLAWITPLWHGTELARDATFGWLRFWPTVGHLAYLLAMFGLGAWLAVRHFRTRLAK
jgi:lipooligosaccharide transport system permease protein